MEQTLTWQEKLKRTIKKQKKRAVKHSVIGSIVSVVVLSSVNVINVSSGPEHAGNLDVDTTETIFSAVMVGDITYSGSVGEVVDRYGYVSIFEHVSPYLQQADYVTGNFRQMFTDRDNLTNASLSSVRSDQEGVKILKENNFTTVNLANSDIVNQEGLVQETIEVLQAMDIDIVGAGKDIEDAEQISYQDINELTVATLGFTDVFEPESTAHTMREGVLPADPSIFLENIHEASNEADLVLVHVHWGQKFDSSVHSRQQDIARAMVDAGADIIIGHHSHVLAPVEVYENSIIFYSLGNFISDHGFTKTRESVIAQVNIDGEGNAQVELIPLYIREATPRPLSGLFDSYHRERIFRQLTKDLDVPWSRNEDRLIFELDVDDILKEQP